ncbi:helix-turn-helix transcriptional regulator [Streptomyces sp. SS52]|uniref:helix-turn-helix transcriptional regulator n=1 Tax=Streptomyces sp. SS52 TaxID=2563602 RepID=UPI00109E4085|nr:helix-turn-helix transcriptional regulator [Streptomyces sp. SS52]QCB23731.1 XRE family transcriptional regulator [Streptomyces sp. SS52]
MAEATEEVKAFALAFQEVLPQVLPGATMTEKARALGISPSLLSHWLHGRRLPRPGALAALRQLIRPEELASTDRLGEDLARMERLLLAARGGHTVAPVPVDGEAADVVAPVPLDVAEFRTPVSLASLPLAARTALLWNLGATLREGECGPLVSALGRKRMNPEMEVLLRSAESAGRDIVKIALAALEHD